MRNRTLFAFVIVLLLSAFVSACSDDSSSGSGDNGGVDPGEHQCISNDDCSMWDMVCISGWCTASSCSTDKDCGRNFSCIFGECKFTPQVTDGDGETDKVTPDGDDESDIPSEIPEFSEPDPNNPKKIQVQDELDFGAVLLGQTSHKTLTVYSVGSEVVEINYRLESYVTPEFVIENPIPENTMVQIPPGTSFDIKISYTPTDPGADEGTILILTNDGYPLAKSVRLYSQEKGNVDLQVDPGRSVDFGEHPLNAEEPKVKLIKIKNHRSDLDSNRILFIYDVQVVPYNSQNFHIETTTQFPAMLAPGEELSLKAYFHPSVAGDLNATMQIMHNDPRKANPYEVEFIGKGVVPELYCRPRQLNFNEVEVGTSATIELKCYNKGDADLIISGTELTGSSDFYYVDPDVPLTLRNHDEYPEDELIIPVTYSPGRVGDDSGELVITSNDYQFPEYRIPITGAGIGGVLFCIPPSPVNFGQRYWNGGDCEPKQIICMNNGYGTLYIKQILLEGNDAGGNEGICTHECGEGDPEKFCMDNPEYAEYPRSWPTPDNPVALQNNGLTFAFDMFFEPDFIQQYWSSITIVWEDGIGNEDYYLIDVMGEGVDCPPGHYDIDPDIPGCEYECEFQSDIDEPDPNYVDANCDGIDGMRDGAIYVSATRGNDRNNGRDWNHPVKTIAKAVLLAATSVPKRDVYVEKGSYFEKVMMRNEVDLYGQYDFQAIAPKRGAGNDTFITPNDVVAVEAKNITDTTVISGFIIQADDATEFSGSSYAIKAINADGLVISYNRIMAGDGQMGLDGPNEGEDGRDGARGGDGESAREDDGSFYCQHNGRPVPGAGGDSRCGTGGQGGWSCKTNGSGCAGSPGQPGSHGAWGGEGYFDGTGGNGGPGDHGRRGNDGAGGTDGGYVVNYSWFPNNGEQGEPGTNGGSGGGGGGGGSHSGWWGLTCADWGGTGGGGGGAGCAGTGGDGGMGGGGSFGIFIYRCSPTIHDNIIVTGDGGDGGNGRDGGSGGMGGSGGNGGRNTDEGRAGGDGGRGGNGGEGGDGGGGAGGISACVFVYGETASPRIYDNEMQYGMGGAGGDGGSYGLPGEDGSSCEVYVWDSKDCATQEDFSNR